MDVIEKRPNAETQKAMHDADAGHNLTEWESVDALFASVSGVDALTWEESFSDVQDNLAEVSLAGASHREGLSLKQLSRLAGIRMGRIADMERGWRRISARGRRRSWLRCLGWIGGFYYSFLWI